VFCFVCISNKTQEGPGGVINNNFICDTATGIIRESKFTFDKDYHDYLIDCHYMGPISMFRTFAYEGGQPKTTPVYYINNETEEIVSE
jgi:hypothetical protein